MILGSMKEVFLTRAKETFLFDLRVAGLDPQTIRAYQDVLDSFVRFSGNIKVRQLTPDHLNLYMVNLSDGPYETEEDNHLVMSHYTVIQTWIHWMYLQKFITERGNGFVDSASLTNLLPSRSTRGLAYCC